MRAQLQIRFNPFRGQFSPEKVLRWSIKLLETEGFLASVKYWQDDRQKNASDFPGLERLTTAVDFSGGGFELRSEKEPEAPYVVGFSVRPDSVRVATTVKETVLEEQGETFLDDCQALISKFVNLCGDECILGPVISVVITGVGYPRLRPPPNHVHFPASAVLDAFDLEFHRSHPLGHPAFIESLIKADKPDSLRRTQSERLLILRWVDKLSDLKEVKAALSSRERWLAETLDLPPDSRYNREGDIRVDPPRMERHPPLTFYQPTTAAGVKALYFEASEESITQALDEPLAWLKAGKLPDGTELRTLWLVVPDRAKALFLRQSPQAAPVSRVFYPSEDGSFWWDPFPPGEWLD